MLRVTRDRDDAGYTELRHGTTLHGRQANDPTRQAEPLSYYHREGPIGQLFEELARRPTSLRIAVIGLGTGTLAAYARPGDAITFYEIDALVRDVAFDRAYFTYTTDAAARGVMQRVELGDARVRIGGDQARAAGRALRRDRRRRLLLRRDPRAPHHPRGPAALPRHARARRRARAAHLEPLSRPDPGRGESRGRRARSAVDCSGTTNPHAGGGTERSTWVALAPTAAALGSLGSSSRWSSAGPIGDPRVGVWTDDFHNLLSVLKWK